MSIVARNDQVITFNPVFEDEHGNSVALDSIPSWSLSNPDVATLLVSEDGLTATVTPLGLVGDVQLNVLIDADPGQGVEPLVGIADITVVGGKIKVIRLVGVVSDKPVPVEPEPETPVEPEVPVDPVLEAGVLIRTTCAGVDKWNVFADGSGGEYQELGESNSPDCGAPA